MIDVVLQNAWVLLDINKDEGDESLPLLACNFSKIFKKKKKNQNVPSDVCYEVAHYQVPSKRQGICKV